MKYKIERIYVALHSGVFFLTSRRHRALDPVSRQGHEPPPPPPPPQRASAYMRNSFLLSQLGTPVDFRSLSERKPLSSAEKDSRNVFKTKVVSIARPSRNRSV